MFADRLFRSEFFACIPEVVADGVFDVIGGELRPARIQRHGRGHRAARIGNGVSGIGIPADERIAVAHGIRGGDRLAVEHFRARNAPAARRVEGDGVVNLLVEAQLRVVVCERQRVFAERGGVLRFSRRQGERLILKGIAAFRHPVAERERKTHLSAEREEVFLPVVRVVIIDACFIAGLRGRSGLAFTRRQNGCRDQAAQEHCRRADEEGDLPCAEFFHIRFSFVRSVSSVCPCSLHTPRRTFLYNIMRACRVLRRGNFLYIIYIRISIHHIVSYFSRAVKKVYSFFDEIVYFCDETLYFFGRLCV